MRILIAEDDRALREVLQRGLREAGYVVLEAGSGAVALALLQVSGPVELLVTDLAMPAMDGMQLANAVRAARAAPPGFIYRRIGVTPEMPLPLTAG